MTDCDFCKLNLFDPIMCPYCNGTGEENNMAKAYIKNHICQCIITDRENCPICNKPCHHDTSLNPKQIIEGGGGGLVM